jgi:dephospho-CoA kinase
MLVVGLTGGIGSGKSTVAKLFSERGIPIIDADIVAREITLPNKPAFKEIVQHFGVDILEKNTINRPMLRKIIFENAKQRRWLEELLHPIIRRQMESQIRLLSAPYCIAVVPLLLEVEFYSFINRILVVDAAPEVQIKRIMTRDKMSKEDIETILKTQATREMRLAKAHDVIVNDGEPADLVEQVGKLHEKYLGMSDR